MLSTYQVFFVDDTNETKTMVVLSTDKESAESNAEKILPGITVISVEKV